MELAKTLSCLRQAQLEIKRIDFGLDETHQQEQQELMMAAEGTSSTKNVELSWLDVMWSVVRHWSTYRIESGFWYSSGGWQVDQSRGVGETCKCKECLG